MQRINLLDEELIDRLIEDPLGDGIVINLYSIMKNDRLFFEFMNEVMKEKLKSNNEVLEKKDINIFIETKIEQNEDIASWSDSTVNKIKQVIKKILMEAKVVEDNKTGIVKKIIMSDWIKNYLIKSGEEKYILAMGERV